ncbi:MAG: mechanosensitive ion channel [Anaerolineales bacterium]|nr:mechanosensitive ion channel [Anaerolineales bacterium]
MLPPWLSDLLNFPVLGTALKLLFVALLFLAARLTLRTAERQIERRVLATTPDEDRRNRLTTLLRAGYSAAIGLLALIMAAMMLQLLGLNILPLLASAGVVGLAISLGAQSLIRDYLSGVLILAEDQFRVGDQIEVAGVSGEVTLMTLRVTYLRDTLGKLHSVPNGDIRVISNVTRDWSRAVVDFTVPLGTDMAAAEAALKAAADQVRADPTLAAYFIAPPEVIAWNNVGEAGVQMRVTARTTPGEQTVVAQALRQAAAMRLRAAGTWPGAKGVL